MLKKFLVFFKVIFIVVLIGAFIVGFTYHNSKLKEKGQSININQTQKQFLIKTDHSSLNIIKNETLENNKNIEDSTKENQSQNDNEIVLDNNMDKTTTQDETHNNSNENQEQIYNNVDNNKEQQIEENNNINDSSDNQVNISVNVSDDVEYDDPNDDIYPTIEACNQAGIDISLTNTVDIINTFCFSHSENGKFLGYKLYINCESGNCDKYKK